MTDVLREMVESTRTPEAELLLLCSRCTLDPVAIQRLELCLTQPLRWPLVLQQANRHGVLSFLLNSLQRNVPHDVPPRVLKLLQRAARANMARSLALTAELSRILVAFADE